MPNDNARVETTRQPLAGWLEETGKSAAWLASMAGISRSVISLDLNGRRRMGRLAALRIEEVMIILFSRREVKVPPLTREQLSPAFTRGTRAA